MRMRVQTLAGRCAAVRGTMITTARARSIATTSNPLIAATSSGFGRLPLPIFLNLCPLTPNPENAVITGLCTLGERSEPSDFSDAVRVHFGRRDVNILVRRFGEVAGRCAAVRGTIITTTRARSIATTTNPIIATTTSGFGRLPMFRHAFDARIFRRLRLTGRGERRRSSAESVWSARRLSQRGGMRAPPASGAYTISGAAWTRSRRVCPQ